MIEYDPWDMKMCGYSEESVKIVFYQIISATTRHIIQGTDGEESDPLDLKIA